jgi:hypothetical protein
VGGYLALPAKPDGFSSPNRTGRAPNDLQTQCRHAVFRESEETQVMLDFIGERGGTRTLDPMIKSHVLYRLSYALTAALCRGLIGAGQ